MVPAAEWLREFAPGLFFSLFALPSSHIGISGDVAPCQKFVNERLAMFLKPLACLANLFDHRYRGRLLSPELRTSALMSLERYCQLLKCECPCLEDVSEFIEARGRFGRLPTLHCTPMSLWQTLFAGDPLAQLASMLTTLPCVCHCLCLCQDRILTICEYKGGVEKVPYADG